MTLRGEQMKGKASVKKVSDKSKKKDKAKEIKRTSVLTGKVAVKKKVVKRVKPGVVKEKKKVKAKIKVQGKAEKKSAKTLTGGKEKEESKKHAKKSTTGKNNQAGKTDKKALPKGRRKIAPKPTVRSGKIRTAAKKTKQVKQAAGHEKKIGRRLTSQKKRGGAAKILRSARIKKPEIKSDIKIAPEPPIKGKLKRGEKERKAVEAGKIPESPGRKGEEPGEIKGREKVHPLSEETYSSEQWKIFPEEYGEDDIKLMTVDPYRLFAFWEVMKDIPEIYRGDLNIRIHDVTGAGSEGFSADSYFDIKVDERIGKSYITVRPAGEFVADIGIIHDGIFISLAKSIKVSTPRAGVSEQGAWPQEIYEAVPPRMGY
jgi:hypothetical protein